MPKADVQRGSAAIAVAGKYMVLALSKPKNIGKPWFWLSKAYRVL